MTKKTKNKLYTQLADKILNFNQHSNRKLELFLGSRDDFKRNLSQNQPNSNQNQISQGYQPMAENYTQMQMQRPTINQEMIPSMARQMPPSMPVSMPPSNQINNIAINQNQNNGKRKLFIGGLIGGLGSAVSDVAGGAGDAAKSVASGLGANGGAGAGLLGAGAGLMMATMGEQDEINERDNLQQDLRNKEFRYMMETGKKTSEMGLMDKNVIFKIKNFNL